MSLTKCIKKAGKALDRDDADAIKALRDGLVSDGIDSKPAGIESVRLHIQDVLAEREAIVEQVEAQGGAAPASPALRNFDGGTDAGIPDGGSRSPADAETDEAGGSTAGQADVGNTVPVGSDRGTSDRAEGSAPTDGEAVSGADAAADGQPALSPAPIEDFGEKLEGARKHLTTVRERMDSLTDEQIAGSTLSQLWPKADLDKIEDNTAAALYHAIRDEIPPKPRVRHKVRRWVEAVKMVRGLVNLVDQLGQSKVMAKMREPERNLGNLADKVELLAGIDRADWGRIGDVRKETGKYRKGGEGEMVPGSWYRVSIDNRSKVFYGHNKVSEIIGQVKAELTPTGDSGKRMKFEIRTNTATGVVFINKGGDKEMRRIKTFDDVKAARKYLNENYDDLVAEWERIKERDNVRKSDLRGNENAERIGEDRRNGRDITPEEFTETLGFRGTQFGNWVKQGSGGQDRQGMLNQAYDAFLDLADIIGVPPKAISLNGELGVAFGARGSGRAAAHFEADTMVINLTKTKGAGSVAHEWLHALDNYFQRKRGMGKTRETAFITYAPENYYENSRNGMRLPESEFVPMSKGERSPKGAKFIPGMFRRDDWKLVEGVRPEVAAAFANLVEVLNESPMKGRAAAVDQGKEDGYWSRIIERAARSFENYVISRLADQGKSNDFLANVVSAENFKRNPERYPYLLESEIAPVAEAFDHLFNTMETRETDLGDGRTGVELYSRSESGVVAELSGNEVLTDDSDPVAAARRFFRENLQGGVVSRDGVGEIRFSGKGWHKLKAGLRVDRKKVELIPAIRQIIERGQYHGREPVSERSDDIVAFHYFDGAVRLRGENVQVGVTVGEDSNGNLFYNLNHDADKLWKKRKGAKVVLGTALAKAPSSAASDGDKFSMGDDLAGVNITILDRKSPGIANAHDTTSLTESMNRAFPGVFAALEKAGLARIVTRDQVPDGVDPAESVSSKGRVLAYVQDGVVTFVADNIAKGHNVKGLMLHEIGVHLRKLGQGDTEFQSILKQFEGLARIPGSKAAMAMARVPKDTPEHLRLEEGIGYLVENNATVPLAKRLVGWFRAQLKKWLGGLKGLERTRMMKWANELSESDLVTMATQAVKSAPAAARNEQQAGQGREAMASQGGRVGSDRTAWRDFPEVVFMADLGAIKNHPMYKAGKAGDEDAAVEVVRSILSDGAIESIRRQIGEKRPVVVPVVALEASGANMLPTAYAHALAARLGLSVDAGIIQSIRAKHTDAGAFHRIASQPVFEGEVEAGQDYLIVDDTMTMGGTLANLRGHIEANGGRVVLASTLTGFPSASKIGVTEKMRVSLLEKHGQALDEYLKAEFGFGIDSLTQGEAGHLRAAPSLDAIRERISEAQSQAGIGQDGQDDVLASRAHHPFTLSGNNPSDTSQAGLRAQALMAAQWDGDPESSAQAAIREAKAQNLPDVVDWLKVNRDRVSEGSSPVFSRERRAENTVLRNYQDAIYSASDSLVDEAGLLKGQMADYEDAAMDAGTPESAFDEKINGPWIDSVAVPLNATDSARVISRVNSATWHHGSPMTDIESLRRGDAGGLFLSPSKQGAEAYSGGGRVYDVSLSVKNPLFVENGDLTADMENSGEIQNAIDAGYDSIVSLDGGDVVVLADSALRRPDILFSRAEQESPDSRENLNRRMREEHHGIWFKAKQMARREFLPGGLLPKSVFDEKVKRDSKMGAVEMDVTKHVLALEEAFKKDFGKSFNDRTKAQELMMRDGLAGNPSEDMPERTAVALEAMRQYVDRYSEQYVEVLRSDAMRLLDGLEPDRRQSLMAQLQEGNLDGLSAAEGQIAQKVMLMQTIASNVGEYVHRSYRAFDDPMWPRAVPDAVLNNARDYLEAQYLERNEGVDESQAVAAADRVIEGILKEGTAFDSLESYIRESKLGAKDLSLLKRRKQIAPEIRALLGEHMDPRVNFAKTATKMTRLIHNDAFLKRVREVGMGVFLYEDGTQPAGAWKTIAAEGNEAYAPLNGLKVSPEINQAFIDALGRENMEGWYRTIVQLNGAVKFGKTVLSPTTAMRNFMSASFFTMANGHSNLAPAWKSLKTHLNKTGDNFDYLRELKELGVVYDTPYAEEMMRLLRDTDMEDRLLNNRMGLKHLLDKAQAFYRFGDDFWKVIGFENERVLLKKHYGLTDNEAKIKAAERIRNTYPTYSMTGRFVNKLRRFPLAGTFVSFPAEIIRTTFHILQYAKQDMAQSKSLGARRVVGITLVAGMAYAAQQLSKGLLGVDDDEEEAVREQLPEWSKNSNLYFLSREDGNLRYVDLSFLDPYNYWKRPITAIVRDQPVKDSAYQAAAEMLSPFFGTDIAFGALAEIWNNKKSSGGQVYNKSETPWEQSKAIGDHLRKAVQPGAFSNLERILQAAQGERTITGRTYSMEDEMAALAGFRVSTLDPGISLKYRSFSVNDELRGATSIISRTVRDPNPVSDEKLRDAFDRATMVRQEAYKDLLRAIKAAEKSGLDRAAVMRQLQAGGVSKRDSAMLANGKAPPKLSSKQYLMSSVKSAADTFGPEVQKEINRRRIQILKWEREQLRRQ